MRSSLFARLRGWINPDPSLAFEAKLYLYATFWTTLFGLGMLGLNLGPEWPWPHTAAILGFCVSNVGFFVAARWGRRFLPLTFVLIVVIGGFVADASFPGLDRLALPVPDRTYAIADIAVGLVSAMLIVSITMTLLIKNFDLERQGANRRLRDLSMKAQTDALTQLGNLASVFRQMVRKTDLVGRYGGEEFILILPGTAARRPGFWPRKSGSA